MTRADSEKKVVGIGIACLDQLILWSDTKAPVDGGRIVDCDMQGGGMAATALVAVTRLGGRAELWGAVGTDWTGDMIVQGLADEQVDTRHVKRMQGRRGPLAVVCVDQPTGDRYFSYWSGYLKPEEAIGSLESLSSAGCLLVDGTLCPTALPAAQEARRLGVPVVGDVGKINRDVRVLMQHMDYAIASESCAAALGTGDDYRKACEAIRAMGPQHVVLTLGDEGLVYLSGDGFGEMKAFAVDVVDTTGAGDVFHGAFCYGLVHGFALEKNLAFASATAAMKCRKLGGRAGIPSRDEVEQFLKDRQARSALREDCR